MNVSILTLFVAVTPMRTAETVPDGAAMMHAAGGFTVLRVDLPGVPVAPVLTGDLELAWGLANGFDLRARYSTVLGLVHRLGPESRLRLLAGPGWAASIRLYPSVQFVGAAQDGVDIGGDVSTFGGLLATIRFDTLAVTVDAGATVQWLLFEDIDGRTFIDDVPYLAQVDLAVELEWATAPSGNYALRLELTVPTAPDDPFTVAGVVPRLLFGGSFGL